MKLSVKQKWSLVGLWGLLSLALFYYACTIPSVIGLIIGWLMIIGSMGYSIAGLIHFKIFERFFAWLTTDSKENK